MQITLYSTATPSNYLIKQLSNARSIQGAIRDGSTYDSMSPIITVAGDIPETLNYAKIGGRYYYIRSRDKDITGLTVLHLHEDVLMSHYDTILSMTAHITRSTRGSRMLTDSVAKLYPNRTVACKSFPAGFSEAGNYILITAGGVL